MIKGVVKGRSLTIIGTDGDVFTSGSVGLKIKFTFDDEWDGLAKQAVFQNGSNAYISTAVNDEAEVPWEVLSIPGRVLRIGIRGTNGTTLVIPTIYAECRIYEGSDKNGASGQEWSPSEVDQVLSAVAAIDDKVGDLDDLDTTDKSSVVNAINELYARPVSEVSFTNAAKNALVELLKKVAYIDGNDQQYLNELITNLAATVTSISAVFTQGANVIYDTDSLDTLRQYLVVTANYSDGTSGVATGYALSGTLAVGTSTITVTYGDKTDTFTVTVTHDLVVHYGDVIVGTMDNTSGYMYKGQSAENRATINPFGIINLPANTQYSVVMTNALYEFGGALGEYFAGNVEDIDFEVTPGVNKVVIAGEFGTDYVLHYFGGGWKSSHTLDTSTYTNTWLLVNFRRTDGNKITATDIANIKAGFSITEVV